MDIDTLKEINDRLGHAAGDEAIRFVAGILSDNAREMDVAARFGGDEFVIICGLATEDDLAVYGRRLVRLVHDSRFAPAEDIGLRLTVSAGGALVAVTTPTSAPRWGAPTPPCTTAKHRGRDEFAVGRRRERDGDAGGGELRRNPASGKLTIVAPARASRPAGRLRPRAPARLPAPSAPATKRSRRRRWTPCVPAAARPTAPAGACAWCPTSTPPSTGGTR